MVFRNKVADPAYEFANTRKRERERESARGGGGRGGRERERERVSPLLSLYFHSLTDHHTRESHSPPFLPPKKNTHTGEALGYPHNRPTSVARLDFRIHVHI